MSALDPRRRPTTRTAREIAEKLGISERSVYRLVAEPRQDYENRAAARRANAVRLRLQGLTYREIADQANYPLGTVGRLLADARRNGEWDEALTRRAPPHRPTTHDDHAE